MDPYLTAYWWMLGLGGAALAFLALSGHLHFGHDFHVGDHGAAEVHGGHVDLHADHGHAGGAEADTHAGGHADAHGEAHAADGGDHEFQGSFGCLNPFMLATFVTFGGVAGVAVCSMGVSGPWSVPPAMGSGLLVAWTTMFGFNTALRRLQGTSSFQASDLAGLEAEVITPVPVNGVGEICFSVKSIRRTSPARSASATAIPRHTRVTIVDQKGSCYLVRPTTDERLRQLDEEPGAAGSE